MMLESQGCGQTAAGITTVNSFRKIIRRIVEGLKAIEPSELRNHSVALFICGVSTSGIVFAAVITGVIPIYFSPSEQTWSKSHSASPALRKGVEVVIQPNQKPPTFVASTVAIPAMVVPNPVSPSLSPKFVVIVPPYILFDNSGTSHVNIADHFIHSATLSEGFQIAVNPPGDKYPNGLRIISELPSLSATTQIPQDALGFAASVGAALIFKPVVWMDYNVLNREHYGEKDQSAAFLNVSLYVIDVAGGRYIVESKGSAKSQYDDVPDEGETVNPATVFKLFDEACGDAVKTLKIEALVQEVKPRL
jgi:hypothetical protein